MPFKASRVVQLPSVEFDHRTSAPSSIDAYYLAVQELNEMLTRNLGHVLYSIILCGSVAKHSVTPGWSDIDLIIVTNDQLEPRIYDGIRDCTRRISGFYHVSIGIDILSINEFRELFPRIPKILGKPIKMAYDLRRYSQVLYGEDLFVNLPQLNFNLMFLEEYFNVLSLSHNFRRLRCQASMDQREHRLKSILVGIRTVEKMMKSYCNMLRVQTDSYDEMARLIVKKQPNFSLRASVERVISLRNDYQKIKRASLSRINQICSDVTVTVDSLTDHIIFNHTKRAYGISRRIT
jgi:predicted nucleotidyltransferase